MDVDANIPAGEDFVEFIDKRVRDCDALIALMGKRWLTSRKGRQRRLDDPLDFVRLEIETALKQRVRVVPVLLEGASMARADQLPDALAILPRRQAIEIAHQRFDEDVKRLIASLDRLVKPSKAGTLVSADSTATHVESAPVVAAQEPAIVKLGTVDTNPKDGLEYVWIPPGMFQMGAVKGDDKAREDEKPRHPVTISKGLWLAKTPVTVAAYKRFARFAEETRAEMPDAPEFNPDWQKEHHPIVGVHWDEAVAYCQWAGGRLPTEAEWEYAARGGKGGLLYPWGNEISEMNANYYPSDGTSAVGSYPANGFGLCDMAGNVREWCSDWFIKNYYSHSPGKDPQGPSSGMTRVLRGGAWNYIPRDLRASGRVGYPPGGRNVGFGFRCAREVLSL